jgi:two-component system phosphate regulon response regulator OmpR
LSKSGGEKNAEAAHILVVDDDRRIRGLLSRFLVGEGYRVSSAASAAEAQARLGELIVDLIVLDVMMPGESGLDLTRSLRAEPQAPRVPELLLTAMGESEDRIAGLEAGAADYLPKPFEPRELVLRIRNILERRGATEETDRSVRFGAYRFDPSRDELFCGDELVHLTAAEAGLLASLAARAGQAVSREDLSQAAQFSGNIRNVDVQMTRLRRKIEADPRYPRYLQTVRGTGYALKPE